MSQHLKEWEAPKSTIHYAKLMEVPKEEAVAARLRYLNSQIGCFIMSGHPIAIHWAVENAAEAESLSARLNHVDIVPNPNMITEQMIASAREVPVKSVVEFENGKSLAWCHDDNNPSLFYGNKTGRAVCPVCNKTFDAIAVLMDRDGYSFADAVRELCSV